MFFRKFHSPGVAHISYMIGSGGHAAVIDPRRDVDEYIEVAHNEGLKITHIFETHRNEDYVIGSEELAGMTGADIYHGSELPFEYGSTVQEGDEFKLGHVKLSILHTPGHTYESISIAVADTSFSDDPVGVFTGDVLFVGDVGRTDFFPDAAEEVAGLLYDSIFDKLLPLGDHVLLWPAHGAGSVCGANMAEREESTLGYEREHNKILQFTDRDEFIDYKVNEHHYLPPYFSRMEEYNLKGSPPMNGLRAPGPMSANEFGDAQDDGMYVLDVRGPEAYGGAHVPGSLSIPLEFIPVFTGYLVPYDTPIGLVVESCEQARKALTYLRRIGYDDVVGYLQKGMQRWEIAGRHFEGIPQVYIGTINERLVDGEDFTLIDVRSKREYRSAHLMGAINIYVGELPERLDEIPDSRPITTFCGSGHRAIIAASILQREGFEQVENCLGSMAACYATQCPMVERGD